MERWRDKEETEELRPRDSLTAGVRQLPEIIGTSSARAEGKADNDPICIRTQKRDTWV